MSRPLPSAPRKKLPVPGRADRDAVRRDDVGELAADLDWSVRWFLNGSVCATWSAYSGAARHSSDDEDEQGAEGERHLVAPQAPQRQAPGADARDAVARPPCAPRGARRSPKVSSVTGSIAMSASAGTRGREGEARPPGSRCVCLLQAELQPVVLVDRARCPSSCRRPCAPRRTRSTARCRRPARCRRCR